MGGVDAVKMQLCQMRARRAAGGVRGTTTVW